ncbi:hypothetical protein SRS16P2_00520 (plasmid) [Variovorax sp. SRS16]|uniref:hypothetical protein n=1 Tax=Variovorax sp. SRS16 TaxID=282217 RepID=UPI001316AFDF|nr:hypothetical protein [Variovorax sp. SRS16]VTU46171.1 hypothetical protein SRS16P2_00520 [Variovorax sp. SRS16]
MKRIIIKFFFSSFMLVGAVGLTDASAAPVGEWNFKLTPNTFATNRYSDTNAGYRAAKAQLFQEGSGYTFRLLGTGVDECFEREMPAQVEKTVATTTIIPRPLMRACPAVRIIIFNDGSGGYAEAKVGRKDNAAWAKFEDVDFGLTPR